nr:acyltransferase family protein [Novosphingobium sp. FKTRR1]
MHHLDAARALFLLLGIPFHVATTAIMILSPEAPGFREAPAIALSLSLIHTFRMSAFFMLSGFFAAMVREKRGQGPWFADRLIRVGVPLVASVASLAVIQYHLKVGLSEQWAGGFHGLPLAFEHLWFLIVLLLFVCTFSLFPLRWRSAGAPWRNALALRGWRALGLILGLALWGALLAGAAYGLELQDNEAVFDQQLLIRYLQYAPAFGLGALAWHWRMGEHVFNLPLRRTLPLALPFVALHVWLDPMARPAFGLPMDIDPMWRLVDGVASQVAGILASLVAFGVLARLASRPSKVVAFLVDGAMAIYLFHMTWAMIAITLMARLLPTSPMPVVQWLVISGLVLLASAGCYLLVRRNTLLALAFCGIRPQRGGATRPARA